MRSPAFNDEKYSNELYDSRQANTSDKSISESHLNMTIEKTSYLNSQKNFRAGRWTEKEHKDFIRGIFKLRKNNWKKLEQEVPTRNSTQIRSHAQKFLAKLLKKYDILNHKRSAMVSKELLMRRDIDPKDKYIIEVLNHYRRKINFINSLKSSKDAIDNYDEILNKLKNDKKESQKDFSSNCNFAESLSYKNYKAIENELFINNKISNEFYIKYRLGSLFQINFDSIKNLKNNTSNYDIISIQTQIKQLIMDFSI